MGKRKGYGLIHRDVMCNRDISVKAKGVYGYLCACAGNKGVCYPSQNLLCDHLKLSGNTVTALISELEKADAIKCIRSRDKGGKFLKNLYIIHPQSAVDGKAIDGVAVDG